MRETLQRAYDLYCRGALIVVAVCMALGALLMVAEIGGHILWFLSFLGLPVSLWLLARRQWKRPLTDRGALLAVAAVLLLMFVIFQFLSDRAFVARFLVVRAFVNEGDTYRLFSAGFLHKDWGHLFFNSLALFLVLPFVARWLGLGRALAVFLLSIPACSIASALFAPPLSGGLGASGGLLGLDGALLVILALARFRDSMEEEDLLYASTLLPSGLGAAFYPGPMVDGPGHLGGFFAGILLTFLLTAEGLPRLARWFAAVGGTFVVVGAITVFLLPRIELARLDQFTLPVARDRFPAFLEYDKQRKVFLEKLPTFTRGHPPDPKFLEWARGPFESATRAWKESLEDGMQKSEPFAAFRWKQHLEVSQLLETQQSLVFDRAFEKPGWTEEKTRAAKAADAELLALARKEAEDLRPSP